MARRRRNRKRTSPLPGILALLASAVLMLLLLGLMRPGPELPPTEPVTLPPKEPTLAPNPYGPEDFVKDDRGYLTCAAGNAVMGIDVSSYQGSIDWEQVRSAGVEYVFIRLGYRGTTAGSLNADDRAQEYYRGANAAGLKVGGYFFSQAISVEEALEEAEFCLDMTRDWVMEMPLVYDWEYVDADARTADVDRRTLTDCTVAFCTAVEKAGRTPMIYFNTYQARDLLFLEELTAWRWWLALYDAPMTWPYRVDFWQYTNKGTVPGIGTDVDLNLWLTE